MKKNTKKICVMLLLAVVAIASYFIAGTYAKYTRALSGSDTATVAKFSVSASGLDKTQSKEISLFETIKEANTTDNEDNVLAGKIAPGTGGEFTTTLTNASEVDVTAKIKLEETKNTSNVPIEYSLDKTSWKSANDITKEVSLDYVGKASAKTTEDVTIYWRWAYTDTDPRDEDDTAIGEKTTDEQVTTKVTAIFTQVD